jgi:hypothetical protein
MEKGKIVADLNGKKIVITKQCDDKEAHLVKRDIDLPLYGTPTIGNYVPPKPLEKRIPYEEAMDFINWDVVNAERAKQDTTHFQVACQDCELGKSGTCPHCR